MASALPLERKRDERHTEAKRRRRRRGGEKDETRRWAALRGLQASASHVGTLLCIVRQKGRKQDVRRCEWGVVIKREKGEHRGSGLTSGRDTGGGLRERERERGGDGQGK